MLLPLPGEASIVLKVCLPMQVYSKKEIQLKKQKLQSSQEM